MTVESPEPRDDPGAARRGQSGGYLSRPPHSGRYLRFSRGGRSGRAGCPRRSTGCIAGGIDLVLLDLSLPDSNGLETFRQLSVRMPLVPGRRVVRVRRRADGARRGPGRRAGLPRQRQVQQRLARPDAAIRDRAAPAPDRAARALADRRADRAVQSARLSDARRRRSAPGAPPADRARARLRRPRRAEDDQRPHGHAEGDQAIRDAAAILQQTFRDSDLVARLGGDEFIVLLRDATPYATDRAQARLARRLREHNAEGQRPYKLSLSMGFARERAFDDASLERLIAAADREMYRSKHSTDAGGLGHAGRR